MSSILPQLRSERQTLHQQARTYLDRIEAEGRVLDKDPTWDKYLADLDVLDRRIAEVEGLLDRERDADEVRTAAGDLGRSGDDQPTDTTSTRTVLPSWSEYRALAEGTGSAGGFMVPTDQAKIWWDLLRRASVFLGAGPLVIDTGSDRLEVPKIGASVTASMIAENAQISPTDLTFEQVVLTPKKLAALTLVSNEALADSSPALRAVVQADHLATIGTTLDSQFLTGSGSGANIRGLRNLSGVTVTPLDTNGRAPTLNDIADALTRLEADNADTNPAIFMHSRTWSTYRKLQDLQNRYQLSPDPSADARRQLFGVPVHVSNALSIAETVGSNSDCSWIGVVDMSRLAVARRHEVEVQYSSDFKFDYDQTAIRSTSRWDLGLLDEEAVEIITGVRA